MTFDFNTLWFILVGILFTGYVVLDGFDLGVGGLHLFTRTDLDRRIMLNAIGPVWDGNEVWLVTGGGALFGAFPEAYATAFSAFYLPFVLLLVALIFRGVAIEFRSKSEGRVWRQIWDISFALGSIGSAFLIGITAANILWGIPLDAHHDYTGTFADFIHPYSILGGIFTVSLFMMHGAIYLVLKTEGSLQAQARKWVAYTMGFFLILYILFNLLTLAWVPNVDYIIHERPHIIGLFFVDFILVLLLPWCIAKNKTGFAFITSCLAIMVLMALFGSTMYPNLVLSYPALENTLTIYNAASSLPTLKIMAIIAALGVPLVLTYTICIYWLFRGKVVLTSESY